MNCINKRVLVLGLGKSGLAIAQWLIYCGAIQVRVADTRAHQVLTQHLSTLFISAGNSEFIYTQDFSLSLLNNIDLVAISPSLMHRVDIEKLITIAVQRKISIWGELDMFSCALSILRKQCAYKPKVLAITGTNGKTTVTNLTNILCQYAGLKTVIAGNVGFPLLEVLRQMLISVRLHAQIFTEKNITTNSYQIVSRMLLQKKYTQEDLKSEQLKIYDIPLLGTQFLSQFAIAMIALASTSYLLPKVWILELSSFQLHGTTRFHPDAATVLNITQDHLDWHGSIAAYAFDKSKVFGLKTVRVLNRDNPLVRNMMVSNVTTMTFGVTEPNHVNDFGLVYDENGTQWLALGVLVNSKLRSSWCQYFLNEKKKLVKRYIIAKRLIQFDTLQIFGLHNALNALAALALCHAIHLPMVSLLDGLRNFSCESHRIEFILTINNVHYYNDSKSTNVAATVAALHALGHKIMKPNRLLLIAGGDGKGQDFSLLIKPLVKYGKAVFLIGRDALRIGKFVTLLKIPIVYCMTLEEAVHAAATLAQAGDIVLLSPACASVDMFRDYVHRADVFIKAVHQLCLFSTRDNVMQC